MKRVDAHRWSERWEILQPLRSGAQAQALKARSLVDGTVAFLKELIDQGNGERRQRMFQEVRSLERLNIPGVPRPIETNAAHFADRAYDLYIAMEFIDGISLYDAIPQGTIFPEAARGIAMAIADIVNLAHQRDVYHRDIKPDNVILRQIDTRPCLVDFGIAHLGQSEGELLTGIGDEVGNRFLRLPEFRAGGLNKRDPRSDITLCVALFFFMLAKVYPRVLLDEHGNHPHQRQPERSTLEASGFSTVRLMSIFDRAFAYELRSRFQDMATFVEALRALPIAANAAPYDGSLEQIREALLLEKPQASFSEALIQRSRLIDEVFSLSNALHGEIVQTDSDSYSVNLLQPNGYGRRADSRGTRDLIAFKEAGYRPRVYRVALEVLSAGSENVLTIRSPGDAPLTIRLSRGTGLSSVDLLQIRGVLIAGLGRTFTRAKPTDSELAQSQESLSTLVTNTLERMTHSQATSLASPMISELIDNESLTVGMIETKSGEESAFAERNIELPLYDRVERVGIHLHVMAWYSAPDDPYTLLEQTISVNVRRGNTHTQIPVLASFDHTSTLYASPEEILEAVQRGLAVFTA